jgi:Rab GDP dissociation inhibitor
MDETYDVIVLGTGLTECVLSGLLSVNGSKVLHIDRNDYYGAECASLNLSQFMEQFESGVKPGDELGNPRKYNIDLIPKFLMADGKLVKILLHTDVTRYLEFKSVDGSYVVKKGKVHKVPSTESEALNSKLLGLLEKKRFRDFLMMIVDYDPKNKSTHKGCAPDAPTEVIMDKFSLGQGCRDFVGHALALYRDDTWQQSSTCWETIQKIKLYNDSLSHYGKSPYLYPLYGLGDLPQAFARLSAIYGGTYMLNKPVDGVVMENGRVVGVQSEGEIVRCNAVIGDPSYFPDKVEQVGEIVRIIGILDHPIPNTNDSESCQIIIPQGQVGRTNDIYISVVSSAHQVAPPGKFLVILSTTVETNNPEAELQPAIDLCGGFLKRWTMVKPLYNPINNPMEDGIFISKSYDATSHFDSVADDVIRLYQLVSGLEDVSHILIPKEADAPQEEF